MFYFVRLVTSQYKKQDIFEAQIQHSENEIFIPGFFFFHFSLLQPVRKCLEDGADAKCCVVGNNPTGGVRLEASTVCKNQFS